jgi:hypothetical protein
MSADLFDPARLRGRWTEGEDTALSGGARPLAQPQPRRSVDVLTALVPWFTELRARVRADLPEHRAVLDVFLEQAESELRSLVESASSPGLAERALALGETLDRLESLLEVHYFQLPRSPRS